MDVRWRRAAAVGVAEREARALEEALARLGCRLEARVPGAAEGLRLLERSQFDLVLAGAVMPGTDGVAFVRRVRALRLSVQPALLLVRPAGLRLPGEADLRELGAAVTDAPIRPNALREALSRLEDATPALTGEQARRLDGLLEALGVPRHRGRDCLARAVALVRFDRRRLRGLKNGVYAQIGRELDLTAAQVERAIRHVIDVAWRTGQIEQQHRLFGDTIDARRGKPTCGEMIAQLAEELRWEGPQ